MRLLEPEGAFLICLNKHMNKTEKLLILAGLIAGSLFFEIASPLKGKAQFIEEKVGMSSLPLIQENSLIAISEPIIAKKVSMVITAYSSTVWETDDTPFITASGSTVRDGIVANNMLPFGTKIRVPEVYGDKIFIVEDRMNSRKGDYHLDIWFEENSEAKEFGAKRTYVDILSD